MQEELVTFETAKLAKEKGFDIPQNKMFSVTTDYSIFNKTDNPEIVKFHNGDKHECSNIPHNWNNETIMSTKYYSAPTQSLLQKWLREVHGIIVEITWQMCSTDYEYAIIDMNNPPNYNDDIERIIGFKTYEEALEAGLFKALKLIKYETVTN